MDVRNHLYDRALAVMSQNVRSIDGKAFVIPSALLYPAAWGWDTPQIALGLHLKDPCLSMKLLKDYLSYQWPNGLIPQIVFPEVNAHTPLDPNSYFPPPHIWYYEGEKVIDYTKIEMSDLADNPVFEHVSGKTTGITQYPIWAINLIEMHKISPIKKDDLREIVEALDKYHRFFDEHRDPLNLSIAAEFHPWIGCDNAPCYDEAMHRIYEKVSAEELALIRRQRVDIKKVASIGETSSTRPTDHDYACFLYLAHSLARYTRKKWEGKHGEAMEDLDFVMYSPMLNGMLVYADECLAQLAEIAGLGDIAKTAKTRALKRHDAMVEHLWSEEDAMFQYYDGVSQEKKSYLFIGSFFPLMSPHLSMNMRTALQKKVRKHFIESYTYPLPTTSKDEQRHLEEKEAYQPLCYWRGPNWINMSALLMPHLAENDTMLIRTALIELVEKNGFREYFDTQSGEGHGADAFGWTAAYIACLLQNENNVSV